MRHPWGRCVALVTLLFIPFFIGICCPNISAEAFFEDTFFEPMFSFLLAPGLIVSILLLAPIVRLFGWGEHTDITVLFFMGGIFSILFWATILYGVYKLLFEKASVPAVVVKAPVKKTIRRKKK